MTETSSPAFQFYPGDFISDTMDMSAEEIGVYWLLICSCWKKKSLPFCEKKRAKISRISLKKFQKYWSNSLVLLFYYHEESGTWQHSRLDKERDKQKGLGEERQKAANARWNKKAKKPDAIACDLHMQKGMQNDALQSSSSSSTALKEKKKEETKAKNAPSGAQVAEVFEEWKTVLSHPLSKLGDKQKSKIKARLNEGWSVDELKQVPRGVLKSDWHMGVNPRDKKFDKIETVFRDSEQVEEFIRLAGENNNGNSNGHGRAPVRTLEIVEAEKQRNLPSNGAGIQPPVSGLLKPRPDYSDIIDGD